jgi:hypothetical protein
MLSHQILKVVADSVNPSLGILVVALPFVKWRGRRRSVLMHISTTIATVLLVYLLRAVFGLEEVWAHKGLDFSTHTAICIVLVVGLSSIDWKTAWLWIAIFLSYAELMVYQAYHSWSDIWTTGVVVFIFSACVRYVGGRWSSAGSPSRTPSTS